MRDAKRGDNEPMYLHMSSFMLNLLCLPHSSATVERVFSSINRMKNKLRNKLSTETLCGLLHSKRLISGANCHNFYDEIMKGMTSDKYKKNCVAQEADDDPNENEGD